MRASSSREVVLLLQFRVERLSSAERHPEVVEPDHGAADDGKPEGQPQDHVGGNLGQHADDDLPVVPGLALDQSGDRQHEQKKPVRPKVTSPNWAKTSLPE